MSNKTFLAGGLCLRLVCGEPIGDGAFFPAFLTGDDCAPDLTVEIRRGPLPRAEGAELQRTNHRRRVLAGDRVYDYTYFPDSAKLEHVPYACAVRQGARITLFIDYDAPLWDTMIFDALRLPDDYLERSGAVVHASFIGVGGDGILFAGQKQAGKSTQADLWQRHRNALVINGDRAVVRAAQDGFLACGVPFCGSSGICRNETRPLRAIVFPEKGTQNEVTPLPAFESFKRIIGCLSYTETDPQVRDNALGMAERIARGCLCLRLVCRPDAGAVDALSRALGYG